VRCGNLSKTRFGNDARRASEHEVHRQAKVFDQKTAQTGVEPMAATKIPKEQVEAVVVDVHPRKQKYGDCGIRTVCQLVQRLRRRFGMGALSA
jgi:hypothetical protein